MKIGIYCYLIADILAKLLRKGSLSIPASEMFLEYTKHAFFVVTS